MRVPVKLIGFFWLFSFNCQDGGVTASGNAEEGNADVIHFECVSIDKKIHGSSDIHCTETGESSDTVPKCKEITCRAPDIPNGYVVERVEEYQKDAVLKYRCSPGFKPREGIPRCAKFGWTLNPECDEVTCVLRSTTFGVKKINPAGKTIFRAGERVEITCTEKYQIFTTKESIKSFTCRDDGQWDHEPDCAEIRCEVPRDQHVHWPTYFYRVDNKLGTKQYYRCISGYDQMAEEATCTRDGWTPNPLCADIRCEVPRDQHVSRPELYFTGDLKPGSLNSYQCISGYDKMAEEATCTRDGWTPNPLCAGKCGPPPNVNFADITEITKNEFNSGERVEYICVSKYTLDQRPPYSKYLTCDQGEWRGNIKCLKPCTVTLEEMDKRGIQLRWTENQKMFTPHEDHITFDCQRGKRLKFSVLRLKCNDGEITLPECE